LRWQNDNLLLKSIRNAIEWEQTSVIQNLRGVCLNPSMVSLSPTTPDAIKNSPSNLSGDLYYFTYTGRNILPEGSYTVTYWLRDNSKCLVEPIQISPRDISYHSPS
jgi:hypothetical protein